LPSEGGSADALLFANTDRRKLYLSDSPS